MQAKQRRTVALVCVAHFVWHAMHQWAGTLLPFLQWDSQPTMSVLQISYVQAFGSFCNVLGAFTLGQFVDLTGSKSVFVTAIVLTSLYYTSLSWAGSFGGFLISQLLRIGFHFDAGVEMYLATVTSERDRSAAALSLGLPTGIALLLGPLAAARVAMWFTIRWSQFVCGVALAGVLLPYVLYTLPDTHDVPRAAGEARLNPVASVGMFARNAALREGTMLRVLLYAGSIGFDLVGKQFLMRRYFSGPQELALLLLVTGASMIFVQFVIMPKFRRALTSQRILQLSTMVLFACYVAINYTSGFGQIILLAAMQAAAQSIAHAETSAIITSSVEPGELGKATGLAAACTWAAHCVVPLYVGHMAVRWHYSYVFHVSAALAAFTLALTTCWCGSVDARFDNVLPMGGLM